MHLSHTREEIREMAGLMTAAATPYTQLSCSENNLATASSREPVGPREVSRASDSSAQHKLLLPAWMGVPGGSLVPHSTHAVWKARRKHCASRMAPSPALLIPKGEALWPRSGAAVDGDRPREEEL